jgi:hypothetical protein
MAEAHADDGHYAPTQAQTNWREALDSTGLPAFDDATTAIIDRLLSQVEDEVRELGKGGKYKNWLPAENDLLLLLWQHKMPYARIHTVSVYPL